MGGESVSEGGWCIRGARLPRWSPGGGGVPEKRSGVVPVIRLPLVHLSTQQTVVKHKLCAMYKALRTLSEQDTAPTLEELSRPAGERPPGQPCAELSAQWGGRCPEWSPAPTAWREVTKKMGGRLSRAFPFSIFEHFFKCLLC